VTRQLSAAQLSAAQLSAASTDRHLNSAPLHLSADVNSAPVFLVPICSTQRHVNSALIQLSACKKNQLLWLETFTGHSK
jgi:hypothetical protein